MPIPTEDLKTLILGSHIMPPERFESAVAEAKRSRRTLPNVLIGRGDISESFLTELLGKYYNVPVADLDRIEIPQETLALLPEDFMRQRGVVLYDVSEHKGRKAAKIAMLDPGNLETIAYLETKLDMKLEPAIASSTSLKSALRLMRGETLENFAKEIEQNLAKVRLTQKPEEEEETVRLAEAVPIIAILDRIIRQAIALDASDIHFEPFQETFLVRYRTGGVLHEILHLPQVLSSILVARVKVLTSLKIDEHAVPQDGRFTYKYEEEEIDVRVSIMPTFWGEKIVMRLLRSSSRPVNLSELGFNDQDLTILESEVKATHGMILTTGPTSSGKTTTLYAILHRLNTPDVNIVTIEDPVEYAVSRINQSQVNTQSGLTFSTGLRSFLRQDPNIILVGEIRDKETAELAAHAALTGHLVLSTLHTNDAPTALPRLLDMGVPPFLIATTVSIVMAQRLVRRICSVCIRSRPISQDETNIFLSQMKLLGESRAIAPPKMIFEGQGCRVCGNTGFRGRVGIYEVLKMSDAIQQLIVKEVPANEIKKQALADGMQTMFEDGVEKVQRGITTLEELLRVVRE